MLSDLLSIFSIEKLTFHFHSSLINFLTIDVNDNEKIHIIGYDASAKIMIKNISVIVKSLKLKYDCSVGWNIHNPTPTIINTHNTNLNRFRGKHTLNNTSTQVIDVNIVIIV